MTHGQHGRFVVGDDVARVEDFKARRVVFFAGKIRTNFFFAAKETDANIVESAQRFQAALYRDFGREIAAHCVDS